MSKIGKPSGKKSDARRGRKPSVREIIAALRHIAKKYTAVQGSGKRGRPVKCTPAQACIVKAICLVLGLTRCRDLALPLEESDELRTALGLAGVPNWNTIYKALVRGGTGLVGEIVRSLQRSLPRYERKAVVADGTGFSQEPYKRYNKHGRKGRTAGKNAKNASKAQTNKKPPRGFTNCVYSQDFESNLVLDFEVGPRSKGEQTLFKKIKARRNRSLKFEAFVADLGFDGIENHAWAAGMAKVVAIPVRCNATTKARGKPGRHLTVRLVRKLGDKAWCAK